MIPDESPPPLLDRFRTFAEERGQIVRRDYFWGGEYTDEDGIVQYAEPRWDTVLAKEEKQEDGKIVVHVMLLDDRQLSGEPWVVAWEHLIELNELGFQRILEEHGYA